MIHFFEIVGRIYFCRRKNGLAGDFTSGAFNDDIARLDLDLDCIVGHVLALDIFCFVE